MHYAKKFVSAVSLVALFGLSHTVFAADAPAKMAEGILVNATGMTLYIFDKEPADGGKSVCNGQCAALWPALAAAADAKPSGAYSVITRDGGAKQWAYKGRPLYLWVKDQNPGDKTGDGVLGVWHVVKE